MSRELHCDAIWAAETVRVPLLSHCYSLGYADLPRIDLGSFAHGPDQVSLLSLRAQGSSVARHRIPKVLGAILEQRAGRKHNVFFHYAQSSLVVGIASGGLDSDHCLGSGEG